MNVWLQKLLEERVSPLYLSPDGLRGHVEQIQSELNRQAKLQGYSGEVAARAVKISAFIRHSLEKAKEDAISNNFQFKPGETLIIYFPLLNDQMKITP